MNASHLLSTQQALAADASSLNRLKYQAGQATPEAIKETAKQFEALFMRELLKSMREATMKSGLMDNEGGDLGSQLLDEQWAVQMTGLPGGLSEMIERQLAQQTGGSPDTAPMRQGPRPVPPSGAESATRAPGGVQGASAVQATPVQARFVADHRAAAQQVARESGIPAAFMIGQAAHETGWGRSEIRHADGRTSHNLFGIKAGPGWKGPVAEVTTTEYVDGVPRKVTAKFRAYNSYAESFRDYARLISQSPRYAQVMERLHSAQAFATGLQQAGYATDPQYAAKLSRVINATLSLQRAQA